MYLGCVVRQTIYSAECGRQRYSTAARRTTTQPQRSSTARRATSSPRSPGDLSVSASLRPAACRPSPQVDRSCRYQWCQLSSSITGVRYVDTLHFLLVWHNTVKLKIHCRDRCYVFFITKSRLLERDSCALFFVDSAWDGPCYLKYTCCQWWSRPQNFIWREWVKWSHLNKIIICSLLLFTF